MAAPAPAPAAAPEPALSQASPGVTITPMDLARPREPFSLYERRGPGQILFDMGVAGDFIGNLTQRNVDKATRRHLLRAGEPLLPRESRGQPLRPDRSVRAGRGGASRRARRIEAGEITVNLAEAYLDAPHAALRHPDEDGPDAQPLRAHERAPRARPSVHRPARRADAVLRRGGAGRAGVEAHLGGAAAVLPRGPRRRLQRRQRGRVRPGQAQPAAGHRAACGPSSSSGDFGAIQLGASVASGQTPERHRTPMVGLDAKYKYQPEGWTHPLFTVARRGLYRSGGSTCSARTRTATATATRPTRSARASAGAGTSAASCSRFAGRQRWALGFRYDWTQFPVNARPRVGGGALHDVHAVGVPPLPARVQAHRA